MPGKEGPGQGVMKLNVTYVYASRKEKIVLISRVHATGQGGGTGARGGKEGPGAQTVGGETRRGVLLQCAYHLIVPGEGNVDWAFGRRLKSDGSCSSPWLSHSIDSCRTTLP